MKTYYIVETLITKHQKSSHILTQFNNETAALTFMQKYSNLLSKTYPTGLFSKKIIDINLPNGTRHIEIKEKTA